MRTLPTFTMKEYEERFCLCTRNSMFAQSNRSLKTAISKCCFTASSAKDGFLGFFTPATLLLAVTVSDLSERTYLNMMFSSSMFDNTSIGTEWRGQSWGQFIRKDGRAQGQGGGGWWISHGCGKDSPTSLWAALMSHKRTSAAPKAEMLLTVGRGIIPWINSNQMCFKRKACSSLDLLKVMEGSKLKGSYINRETWHFLGNTTDAGR